MASRFYVTNGEETHEAEQIARTHVFLQFASSSLCVAFKTFCEPAGFSE